MPERIQLKRTKGWKMPENTVKVDRTTKWGNPFPVAHGSSPKRAVEAFKRAIEDWPATQFICFDPKDIQQLRGKNLACWCKIGDPCHADILLEIANADQT